MGIVIQEVIYINEKGDRIRVDFADTDIDYRSDRLEDLRREMVSHGLAEPKIDEAKRRRMGPPPLPKKEGEEPAFGYAEGFEF